MWKSVLTVVALTMFLPAVDSEARDPEWSGLSAVAVSPDGATIAVGGQSRVLFLVDAADLSVKKRIWTGARIGSLVFSKDGSRLVMEDEREHLHFYDTKTWEITRTLKGKAWSTDWCVSADLLAGVGGSRSEREVRFLTLVDGKEQGFAKVAAEIAAIGFDAEGKRVAVLTAAVAAEEKWEPSGDPAELKGLEKEEFKQRNDGKQSRLMVFEVPSGKLLREHTLWYRPDNRIALAFLGDTVYTVPFGNRCAKIDKEGKTTLFEFAGSFKYGRAVSDDNRVVIAGGLRDGSRTVLETMEAVEFKLDHLPGWPEYWAAFEVLPDGSAYGVTSSFRLAKISKDGKIEKVVPVY